MSAAASDYKYQEAFFGLPPYGESISLPVYYADSEDLCDGTAVKTDVGYPERPLDDADGSMPSWPTCILMVDQGGCSFMTKARNAMNHGAAAVIIAGNSCMCSDDECVNTYPNDICEQSQPDMANDGSPDDITIPSLFLARLDANAIKDTLKANTEVKIVLDWKMPQTHKLVEYNIWMTPVTDLSDFRKIAMALGDGVKFTPHMWITDGLLGVCRPPNAVAGCADICTNDGRYCAASSSDNHGILGSSIVEESLRRLCIWQLVGAVSPSDGDKWWNYTHQFQNRCMSFKQFSNPECIQDSYQRSGLNETLISECMRLSGGLESNETNHLFEAELVARTEATVVDVPALFVNNVTITGHMSALNLFRAICAGYNTGSAPEICATCFDPACAVDPVSCASTKSCVPSEEATEGGDGEDVNHPGGNGSYISPINNYDMSTGGGLLVDILSSLAGTYDGIQECGVDLGQFASSTASLLSQPNGDGAMALANLDEECPKKLHFKFVRALDRFNSCAGWNIQQVIETLPSAMVGSLIRCGDLFAANDDASTNAAMEECIAPILGDNPIGEALRAMYLEPDKACPCFQALSDSIPTCKLAVWPVPLIGSWIKKTTCLMASLGCGSIESFCLGELQALDTCLPKDDQTKSCEPQLLACPAAANSVSLSMPPSMLGIPLPDACIRIYEDQKNTTFAGTNVVARYQIFQKYCRAKGSIWSANHKPAASDGYIGELQAGGGKASDEMDVGAEASSVTSTSGFQLGVASGLGIALILGIFTVAIVQWSTGSNEAQQKAQQYKQVELVEC